MKNPVPGKWAPCRVKNETLRLAQGDSAASPLLKSGIDFFGVIYRSEHSLLCKCNPDLIAI